MAKFGLIKPFDIDSGELDGISPHECFVLGYELSQIDELLKLPEAINRPVHAQNKERIEKACKEAGRIYKIDWMNEDSSESWLNLSVLKW